MFDWKSILARGVPLLQQPLVRLLVVYPWSGKASILSLEEACRKPGSTFGIALLVTLAVCLSLLGGLLASFSGTFYFSLISQIYRRDGLLYLWQPLAVIFIEILSVLAMAFSTARWLDRWHDYAPAKWAWFSFVVTAGVLTTAMNVALYAGARILAYSAPFFLHSDTVIGVIAGCYAVVVIFGSLLVYLSLVLRKVKQVVQTSFYRQYWLPIVLALGVIWTCFLLGPTAFLQSLHSVRGDPAKREPVWKLPTVGMTMIGCDAADRTIVCAFTLAPDDLPDLVVMGRWHSFDAGESKKALVAWEVMPEPRRPGGTVSILPQRVLDIMLRVGREEVCLLTAQGKVQAQFRARARGTTPPFNERQRLPLVVVNAATFAQELSEVCSRAQVAD